MSMAPSDVSTRHVFASEKTAQPCTTRTLARSSSPTTPLLSRSMMPSFHLTMRPRSSRGGCSSVMPSALPPTASAIPAKRSAAWISAFDVDQHSVDSELAGADRRDIAAHAAADHQHAGAQSFRHCSPHTSISLDP